MSGGRSIEPAANCLNYVLARGDKWGAEERFSLVGAASVRRIVSHCGDPIGVVFSSYPLGG